MRKRIACLATVAVCAAFSVSVPAHAADGDLADLGQARRLAAQPPVVEHGKHPPIDRSGRKQAGKASFYGHRWAGQKMANGRRFNPNAHTAASKSLPLGTVARVTNLSNGKSALVTVQDRGPYVDGRIVDLTLAAADEIGITEEIGIAPVVVAPVAVPQPDGEVKPGAGAAEVPPDTAAEALREARELASPAGQQAER